MTVVMADLKEYIIIKKQPSPPWNEGTSETKTSYICIRVYVVGDRVAFIPLLSEKTPWYISPYPLS